MLSTKESALVYQTLLSSPGMNDNVKIDLRISRKYALFLVKAVEMGLSAKDDPQGGLLTVAGNDSMTDLNAILDDVLQKAGLRELYDRLNVLGK